jgi:hypothetical protein
MLSKYSNISTFDFEGLSIRELPRKEAASRTARLDAVFAAFADATRRWRSWVLASRMAQRLFYVHRKFIGKGGERQFGVARQQCPLSERSHRIIDESGGLSSGTTSS